MNGETQKTEKDPNINIKDYYLELNPSDLEHTFKHSKEDIEYPGNVPLTMEDMKNIPNYIENFTDIIDTVNKKTKNNKVKKIRIGTRVNGYSIITTIVSDGRNSVRPKTMYKVNTEDYLKLLNGEKIKKKRANVDAQAQRLEDDPNGSPSIVNSSSEENILYNNKNVKFSLADNQGRQLTKELVDCTLYGKEPNGELAEAYRYKQETKHKLDDYYRKRAARI